MEPATASGLTAAVVGLLWAVVEYLRRAGKDSPAKSAWNGNERRTIDAAINEHIIHCPNITKVEISMERGFAELKAEIRGLHDLLEAHKNMAHR